MPDTVKGNARRLQPIVWMIKHARHFGMLDKIQPLDIPWSKKQNTAVFRGSLTGIHAEMSGPRLDELPDKEKCLAIPRCRLVFITASSPLVNTSLIKKAGLVLLRSIDGIDILLSSASRLNYENMLKYKAIIMLEGNDLSSGFKWALLSNSVVMTQDLVYTSWAMEELLEPWVHYIPLNRSCLTCKRRCSGYLIMMRRRKILRIVANFGSSILSFTHMQREIMRSCVTR
jgi:hypothetical protein